MGSLSRGFCESPRDLYIRAPTESNAPVTVNLSHTIGETREVAERVDITDLLKKMITGAQIRMARAALGWTVADLERESGVSASSIQRAEHATGIPTMKSPNLFRIQRALENGGVLFIDADDIVGPGVRLRRWPPSSV
jgi:hypothetical protein